MKRALILGGGGLAREMAHLLVECGGRVQGYIAPSFISTITEEQRVGDDSILEHMVAGTNVVLGIGKPDICQRVVEPWRNSPRLAWPNVRHPSATGRWAEIEIGVGVRVCAGVQMTIDIVIGSFCLFNLNCTVGHDVVIGDYCVVNPGANISGGVVIGNGCLIGTGAQILEGRKIGDGAIVGAGAVVTRDVLPGTVVTGVPARQLETIR